MIVKDKEAVKTNMKYVYLITTVAALGGLLFGYDTAVIAGAIGFLQTKFELSSAMTGWAASSAIWGCLFGAMIAGYASDRLGRKKVLLATAVLFSISAIGVGHPEYPYPICSCQVPGRGRCRGGFNAIPFIYIRDCTGED